MEQNANVLENWLDSLGDGRRPLDRGQEVRDAGHDDDVRLSANLPQGVAEDLEVTTRKNLGILDGGICTTVRLIDIVPDIGVTEQGVDSNLRHRENVKRGETDNVGRANDDESTVELETVVLRCIKPMRFC